jgi:ketosteroid isomerase-like protein
LKTLAALCLALLLGSAAVASEAPPLSTERIHSLVAAATEAGNRMMMRGSAPADVDAVFALYHPDFVYVHQVYGGQYSREQLYRNSLRNLEAGRFKLEQPRYRVQQVLTGLNAAAVERIELPSGKVHLAVFEFKDDRISRITEYWK